MAAAVVPRGAFRSSWAEVFKRPIASELRGLWKVVVDDFRRPITSMAGLVDPGSSNQLLNMLPQGVTTVEDVRTRVRQVLAPRRVISE